MPVTQIKALRLVYRVYDAGLKEFFAGLATRFGRFVDELIYAFPNPIKMLDAVLTYSTSFVAPALSLPLLGATKLLETELKERGWDQRVMRADHACLAVIRSNIDLLGLLTFTGESGIRDRVATAIGTFVWNGIKRIVLIKAILKVQTVEELILLIQKNWLGKIGLWRVLGTFAAIGWAIALLAGLVTTLAVAWSTSVEREFLPNNSKRHYEKRTRQTRIQKKRE